MSVLRRPIRRQPKGPVECGPGGEWWDAGTGDTLGNRFAPGTRLWVQEVWQDFCPLWDGGWCGHGTQEGIEKEHKVAYRATGTGIDHVTASGKEFVNVLPSKWRRASSMPRWASRLRLEVVAARVERLWDIADGDIAAEGFEGTWEAVRYTDGELSRDLAPVSPREQFAAAWDAAYVRRGLGWQANPFVWVVSFRRVEEAG